MLPRRALMSSLMRGEPGILGCCTGERTNRAIPMALLDTWGMPIMQLGVAEELAVRLHWLLTLPPQDR